MTMRTPCGVSLRASNGIMLCYQSVHTVTDKRKLHHCAIDKFPVHVVDIGPFYLPKSERNVQEHLRRFWASIGVLDEYYLSSLISNPSVVNIKKFYFSSFLS